VIFDSGGDGCDFDCDNKLMKIMRRCVNDYGYSLTMGVLWLLVYISQIKAMLCSIVYMLNLSRFVGLSIPCQQEDRISVNGNKLFVVHSGWLILS
jgi:hypothetical protein